MRKPCGLMVLRSVFALGVVLGVVAHGVKVARIVADGVAVVAHTDSVLSWLLMAKGCTDYGEGVEVGVVCLLVA